MATIPFHRVNVLTGVKGAMAIEDPGQYANLIKRSRRPLLILGRRVLEIELGGKPLLDYAIEIADASRAPICATAHVAKAMIDKGRKPESTYDVIEIVNFLKDPGWRGVKGEGNHDLVMFLGFRTDIGNQALSTLKHFAPHLKTMTLCKFYYPNADYSLPTILKDEKWKEFLDKLIEELKKGG